MATRDRVRSAALDVSAQWILGALIAVRLLVVALVLIDPPPDDPWIVRAETIATSPATPYRDFAIALMPLETAAIDLIGGDGVTGTARRVAVIAVVADLTAAAALAHGWGRRAAGGYLLLGLPLLGIAYLRLDFVSVALAAWAAALLRSRRDGSAGTLMALAILCKLWPVALIPAMWIGRRTRALAATAIVAGVAGVAWFAWGGRDGPFHVLGSRGALGWAVDSTVGNVAWIVSNGQTILEAGVLRLGVIPAWAKALLLVGLALTLLVLWYEAARDRARDPFGGTALAVTASLLVFAPVSPVLHGTWLVPWAAIALQGDREARRVASVAAVSIALSGILALRSPEDLDVALRWLAFARNACLVGTVVLWVTRPEERLSPAIGAP